MNTTEPDWRAHQLCKHCNGGDWDAMEDEDSPMVLCDCCLAVGAHLQCLSQAGVNITSKDLENPAFQWFCSEGCTRVAQGLVEATNQRRKLEKSGMFTTELIRYSEKFRTSQQVVGSVVTMFRSVFARADYSDGSDLVELVCQGANHQIPNADAEDQPPDCSNFLNFVLRKSGHIVAAAVVRAHGTLLAEVPYVVTKEGYRREGHCRRLMAALEGLLRELGVQWIVVPGAEATVSMWKDHLGFSEAGKESAEQLEERIIVPEGTRILLKKVSAEAPAATAPAAASHKRVRFSMPLEAPEDSDDDSPAAVNPRKISMKTPSKKRKSRSGDDDEFTLDLCSDGDEDEEEEEDGDGMAIGCSKCGTHQKHALYEDEETGDMLCDACCGKPSGSGAAGGGGGGKVCYHCGTNDHPKYQKHSEGTGWECGTCVRYRKEHDGELRPARLFKRKKSGAGTAAGAAVVAVKTPTPNKRPASGGASAAGVSAIVSGLGGLSIPEKAAQRGRRLKESLGLHSSRLIKFAASAEDGAAVLSRAKAGVLNAAASACAGHVALAVLKLGGGADAKILADLRSQAAEMNAATKGVEDAVAAQAAAESDRAALQAAVAAETEKRLKAEAEVEALRELVMQMQAAQQKSAEPQVNSGGVKEPAVSSPLGAGGSAGGGSGGINGGKPPSFQSILEKLDAANPPALMDASPTIPENSLLEHPVQKSPRNTPAAAGESEVPAAHDDKPSKAAAPSPAAGLFALFQDLDDGDKQGSGETVVDDNEETAEEEEDMEEQDGGGDGDGGGEGDMAKEQQHVEKQGGGGGGGEENVKVNSPAAYFDNLLKGPEVLCSQGSQAKK